MTGSGVFYNKQIRDFVINNGSWIKAINIISLCSIIFGTDLPA